MSTATINKKVNQTANEMQQLIVKSKRKLLELEVMLSLADIKKGNGESFKSAEALLKKLK